MTGGCADRTVGEHLITLLEKHRVDTVFGIPGVHTVELYRGLAASTIRHITPRHEQGAGFMADGYARVSGKLGVCLLISGPGLTNALTAMAQARADRVPMVVISAVNARATLGQGRGHLHELPNQSALLSQVVLATRTLWKPARLECLLSEIFAIANGPRPGPVHLEIPIDVMSMPAECEQEHEQEHEHEREQEHEHEHEHEHESAAACEPVHWGRTELERSIDLFHESDSAVILAGGGVVKAAARLRAFAEALDAPVVSTVNARGVMANHPLDVPASPSLVCVRKLLAEADLIVAIGTEWGPTDYDMYERGPAPLPTRLVRVDSDPVMLDIGPQATSSICSEADDFLDSALRRRSEWQGEHSDGQLRAEACRASAQVEAGEHYFEHLAVLSALWQVLPEASIVGDSTQLVYAGNLYVDAPRPGSWFNSATGFGTLGYAPAAAIGAWLAEPTQPIICLVGDGGLQFSLAELGSARDVDADVVFLVWNNRGYLEIEEAMKASLVQPLGVSPTAPDFVAVAVAYGLAATKVDSIASLRRAVAALPRPCLVEWLEH